MSDHHKEHPEYGAAGCFAGYGEFEGVSAMNAPAPTELLKLAPCPFCESQDVEMSSTASHWPAVGCNECGALGPCTDLHSDKAAEAWSRRSASVGAEVAVEAEWQSQLRILIQAAKDGRYSNEGIGMAFRSRLDDLEAALAFPSRSEGVSKGEVQSDYVLMPREATRAMTMAACDYLPSCEHVFGYAGELLRKCYAIMVKTAARDVAQAAQVPAAWLVKWAMKNSGPQASAYLKEDDARRAAKNVEAYSHATGVEVLPVYTAQPLSAPLPHKLPFHDETMDRLDSLTIRTSPVPSADRS